MHRQKSPFLGSISMMNSSIPSNDNWRSDQTEFQGCKKYQSHHHTVSIFLCSLKKDKIKGMYLVFLHSAIRLIYALCILFWILLIADSILNFQSLCFGEIRWIVNYTKSLIHYNYTNKQVIPLCLIPLVVCLTEYFLSF